MILIKEYRDESRESKYDRKRAVIACERCHEESDVRFTYVNDCIKNNRKYCKSCKMRVKAEEFMQEHNSQEPLSKCLRLIEEDDTLKGEFECSKCGSVRTRVHSAKAYTQLCSHCIKLGVGQKHEIRYDHRLARIFRAMKDRCYNKNIPQYQGYGSIGVTICQEWLDDRTKFYDWALSSGYEEHLQCDKDKGSAELNISPSIYSPATCTWMTRDENNLYKKSRTNTGKEGISLQENGTFRLRNTINFPQEKESQIFKTLDLAIQAISQQRKE